MKTQTTAVAGWKSFFGVSFLCFGQVGCGAALHSEQLSTEPPVLAEPAGGVGVLVMAHGGSDAWNASVLEAVAPLHDEMPVAVAFGMADPLTLESGLQELAAKGVDRVAVVRLFVSGASFYDQTAYLLGLSPDEPRFFMHHAGPASERHMVKPHDAPAEIPPPIETDLSLATHLDGLMGSPEVSNIVLTRALAAARDPYRESVLLVAHGMGAEDENERLLAAIDVAASAVRGRRFASVSVEALREDWPEQRARAEDRIRGFVAAEAERGRTVVVVPYRLSGFGPYADVLEGLDYVATEGLLPHPGISSWIRRTASKVVCEQGWASEPAPCEAIDRHAMAGG